MTNKIIAELEKEQVAKLTENTQNDEVFAGDTVAVVVKINDRRQTFEGVCIAKSNNGVASTITVRKVSAGEGVERVFPIYSTNIDNIKVLKRGKVRRAKLYYIRHLSGKLARIAEATSGFKSRLSQRG